MGGAWFERMLTQSELPVWWSVWQGYRVMVDGNAATIAPAYRFVTDLGEDAAYTALPGGRDGSVLSRDYASGITDYLAVATNGSCRRQQATS